MWGQIVESVNGAVGVYVFSYIRDLRITCTAMPDPCQIPQRQKLGGWGGEHKRGHQEEARRRCNRTTRAADDSNSKKTATTNTGRLSNHHVKNAY